MSAVSFRSQRRCALLLALPLSLSALALPALSIATAQDAPPASEHSHADHSEHPEHAASAAGAGNANHAGHASSAQNAEAETNPDHADHASRDGHDLSAHADSTSAPAAEAGLPASASTDALPGTAPPAPSLYVCPMHPQISSETPGSCPICGMDLVARSRSAAQAAPVIEVDAGLRQALGIRTAEVERRVLSPRVRAPAEVVADQHRIRHVHTRVPGWIEELRVHALGERVRAGQVLMELYAPDLVAAQEDYLIALRSGGAGSRAQRSAGERLRRLGVDDEFIAALAQRGSSLQRVPVRAPGDGVVTMLDVRHGMYVEPSTIALEITDLDEVWVSVAVFPEELERLGSGTIYAALNLPNQPDRLWRGEVSYVYPSQDAMTRTVQLRVPVPNRRGLLRVGQYMEARLRGEDGEPVLTVPSEAVIRSADGERVVLDAGEGRFRVAEVHAGLRADGRTQILHGLKEGERVVVSAQFLLDSEAALRAGLQRLEAGHAH
jgi:Cu(I)/Ag(I) efflux system membrane fusion protein